MVLSTNNIVKDLKRWEKSYNRSLLRDELSNNSIMLYTKVISRFISYIEDEATYIIDIKQIDSEVVFSFLESLDEKYYQKFYKHYTTNTKNLYIVSLRMFFLYIENKADILDNGVQFKFDFQDLKRSRGRKAKGKTVFKHLSDDEFENLIHYLDVKLDDTPKHYDYVYSLAIKIMLYGGLRISETLNLKFGNFKIIDDSLCELILEETKSGVEQYVPIPLKYIKKELDYFFNLKHQDDNYIISNQKLDKPIDRSNFYRRLKQIYKHCNINKKGIHILRHTSAMRLLAKTKDITIVQALLRHSNIQTTNKYAKRTQAQLKEEILKTL